MSPASIDAALRPPSRAGRGVLSAYLAVLLYASLSPFFGWSSPLTFTLLTWPKYWTLFDTLANVLAYLPFGVLLADAARHRHRPGAVWWRVARPTLIAGAFSVSMELLQAYLPGRASSPLDVLTNTVGASLGALLVVLPAARAWLHAVVHWRRRHFAQRSETDWGLLLLALWLFAQLNPSIPFFEAGSIGSIIAVDRPSAHPYDPVFLVPQVVGIALNACGFALFVSLLLAATKRVVSNVMVVMLFGLVAKISMASLLMKAPQLALWLAPATVMGFAAGLFAFLLLGRIVYRWRALAATLLVFAGGALAKMTSVYRAFDETLRLFDWPYGHLATFANLTSWVHEVWPLAAFLFLALVFIRQGWSEHVN